MFPCQSLGWCHKVVPKYNSWWQTFVGSKTLVPHKCAYGSRPTPPPIRWKFCACVCTLDTRRLTNTLKPRYNNNPPCLIWPASQIYRLTELGYLLWTSEKCTMMCSNLIFPFSVLPWPLSWPRYGTYACVTILDRSCARLSFSFPLLASWLVHPVVVGFLTVYAAAAVNSPHGRCGSCFFQWQQQNSSSRVVITHISSRNRRRGFFSLFRILAGLIRVTAWWNRCNCHCWLLQLENEQTGDEEMIKMGAEYCAQKSAEYCAEYCIILCRIFCADARWGESIVMGWTPLVLLGFVIY